MFPGVGTRGSDWYERPHRHGSSVTTTNLSKCNQNIASKWRVACELTSPAAGLQSAPATLHAQVVDGVSEAERIL